MAGPWREMHEANVARPVLPACPVKREIIEIVAEIGSGRAGGDGRKVSRPQMPGELRGWNVSDGRPTRAKLEQLGMGEVADTLESAGRLGR